MPRMPPPSSVRTLAPAHLVSVVSGEGCCGYGFRTMHMLTYRKHIQKNATVLLVPAHKAGSRSDHTAGRGLGLTENRTSMSCCSEVDSKLIYVSCESLAEKPICAWGRPKVAWSD